MPIRTVRATCDAIPAFDIAIVDGLDDAARRSWQLLTRLTGARSLFGTNWFADNQFNYIWE